MIKNITKVQFLVVIFLLLSNFIASKTNNLLNDQKKRALTALTDFKSFQKQVRESTDYQSMQQLKEQAIAAQNIFILNVFAYLIGKNIVDAFAIKAQCDEILNDKKMQYIQKKVPITELNFQQLLADGSEVMASYNSVNSLAQQTIITSDDIKKAQGYYVTVRNAFGTMKLRDPREKLEELCNELRQEQGFVASPDELIQGVVVALKSLKDNTYLKVVNGKFTSGVNEADVAGNISTHLKIIRNENGASLGFQQLEDPFNNLQANKSTYHLEFANQNFGEWEQFVPEFVPGSNLVFIKALSTGGYISNREQMHFSTGDHTGAPAGKSEWEKFKIKIIKEAQTVKAEQNQASQNLSSGELTYVLPFENDTDLSAYIIASGWSHDGKYLAVGDDFTQKISRFDGTSLELLFKEKMYFFETEYPIGSGKMNPNGTTAASMKWSDDDAYLVTVGGTHQRVPPSMGEWTTWTQDWKDAGGIKYKGLISLYKKDGTTIKPIKDGSLKASTLIKDACWGYRSVQWIKGTTMFIVCSQKRLDNNNVERGENRTMFYETYRVDDANKTIVLVNRVEDIEFEQSLDTESRYCTIVGMERDHTNGKLLVVGKGRNAAKVRVLSVDTQGLVHKESIAAEIPTCLSSIRSVQLSSDSKYFVVAGADLYEGQPSHHIQPRVEIFALSPDYATLTSKAFVTFEGRPDKAEAKNFGGEEKTKYYNGVKAQLTSDNKVLVVGAEGLMDGGKIGDAELLTYSFNGDRLAEKFHFSTYAEYKASMIQINTLSWDPYGVYLLCALRQKTHPKRAILRR